MTRNLIAVPQMLLLALFACAVALDVAVNLPPVKPMDEVHVNLHAEAGEVMSCNNIERVYAHLPGDKNPCQLTKFEFIKRLKDGRLCNMVTFSTKAGLLVKTAYAYDWGVGMDEVEKIMASKGCVDITP
jgi:hypothetical protein